MNALSSSHFVIRTIPVPSQKIILSRSFRFDLKTKTLPQYGSAPNACATIATKPWTPRRKSIGRDATNTFKSPRRPITTRDAARPTQPKASWRQRPREHERARQPSQSQSSVGAMPISGTPSLPPISLVLAIATDIATGTNSGAFVAAASRACALARFRQ